MEQSTGSPIIEPVAQRIKSGLHLLLQSRQLAQEVERDVWEFAVEKEILNAAGLSNSDLRWMICQELVEHAIEVKDHPGPSREFCRGAELSMEDRSCFILTPAGERFAHKNGALDGNQERNGNVPTHGHAQSMNGFHLRSAIPVQTPTWDSSRHQLRVGSTIVKEYKLPSPNQETILAAFEEEGWPPCIDDPLPVHPDLDPKRRLHDTIKSLNRNQRNRKIRFMGDGTGEGVRWDWIRRE